MAADAIIEAQTAAHSVEHAPSQSQDNQITSSSPAPQEQQQQQQESQQSMNYDDTSEDESDGEEGPHEGYAMLKFGDSCYVMQALQLLIGRDMLAHRAGEFFNSQLEVIQSGNTLIWEAVLPGTEKADDTSTPPENGPEDGTPNTAAPEDDSQDVHQMMESYCRERESDAKSTDTCPFLNIHNPKSENDLFNTGSNISRRHCKIYYDADEGSFMIHVLSKNGLFLDGALETIGQAVELRHGSKIGIGQTEFVFELPNGGEESRIGYGFQNSQGDDIGALYSSSEEQEDSALSELEMVYDQDEPQFYSSGDENSELQSSNEADSDDEEPAPEHEPVRSKGGRVPKASQKIRLNLSQHAALQKGQGQKGSKSQKSSMKPKGGKEDPSRKSKSSKSIKRQTEIKQDEDDEAEANDKTEDGEKADKPDRSSQDPDKSGVTRDSEIINGEGVFIEGLPMGAKIPPKKKGPGRPPKNGFLSKRELNQMSKAHKEAEKNGITDLNAAYLLMESKKAEKASKANRESGGGDGEDGDKDGNDSKKKAPRIARSPSPEMKLSDYTEEQLQRPPDNYVVLIYEALVNHPQKKMNLQQIYSSIERRYPFFKFKTGTSGWQSSVRHNLGQNSTFQKVEKDGKGWMWGVVPGVTLESIREKKKKATPPVMPPPVHHDAGPAGYPYSGHPQPYPHPSAQANPASHPNYLHGQAIPRPPAGQAPNGLPTTAGVAALAMAGQNRPNTVYNPPYNQGSQRPVHANNHSSTPYNSSPGIRPAQPGYSHASNTSNLPNAPNRSLSVTPNLPPHQRPKPIPRPSPDVIDTFISVFTSSFRDMKYGQEITEQKANIIVRNAVARVLEPESVAHVPEDPSERAIISAFRKCLEQSQPRQDSATAPRTYSNYLYPYASRNQSSVFGTPGASNITNRPAASHLGGTGTSNGGVAAISNAPQVSKTPVSVSAPTAPVVINDRPSTPGLTAFKPAASSNVPSTTTPPAAVTAATVPTASSTGNATASAHKVVTPVAGTPVPTSAILATSVQQMLANTASTRESPRAPAIEPITPPAGANSSKRSIDDVEAVEAQSPSKKTLIA